MLGARMLTLDAKAVAAALPYEPLIGALAEAFASAVTVPPRAHHDIAVANAAEATLLVMPAWREGRALGVKIATVFPDNARAGLPAVFASYLLMDGNSGAPLAFLDGTELTLRRTAAASALASRYLSRPDATRLLMVGTGNLAPHLIAAHATVRPVEFVTVWGRRREAAEQLADRISASFRNVKVADSLEREVKAADIISCATLATDPLIKGTWLQKGQHLDLVGAFKPEMREADTDAVRRAAVYVDTLEGALSEAGELVQALASKAIGKGHIKGELRDLAVGRNPGRQSQDAITLFKSVGTALEDLAAAELALRNYPGSA